MSTLAATAGWSRRRWGFTIAAVFVGQLIAIFGLSERPGHVPALQSPLERFSLIPDRLTSAQVADQPWLADPAAAALASPRGFTGGVWRDRKQVTPTIVEWTEAPRWLRADANRLGVGYATVGLPATALTQVSDRPRPSFYGSLLHPHLMTTNSTLQVEGELAGRAPANEPLLPVWPHTDILQPTTLAVLVDDHGAVLSSTLLSGSGLVAADQKAMELARSARFAAVPAGQRQGPLAWGRLVFRWGTVPFAAADPPEKATP